MKSKKVLIAADHAGVELKESLIRLLREYEWEDLGPSGPQSVDYPNYARALCEEIQKDKQNERLGILICGSGIGMSIAANKFRGIRAALVENPLSAKLSRSHNNANVLCLASRFLAPEYAAEITREWLKTPFSQEDRHQKRIDLITQFEEHK